MKEFTEAMRYEYDLTPQSVVIDAGAHKGTFAYELAKRYGCEIFCFEPIEEFYETCLNRFLNADRVHVLKYGLGAKCGCETFQVKGDMTGKFAEGPQETVLILGIQDALNNMGDPLVDLLKINIEGGEYELLEAILNLGLTDRFRDIQVQFHGCIPDAVERRESIRTRLALTHELTYDCPFIWENWRRK